MEQRIRPDDTIMIHDVKQEWLNLPEDMPLQEKFKHLIKFAKNHWMVTWQNSQMQNTIMALGSVYKDESEDKFRAYHHLTGMLLRTQQYVNEMIGRDEDDLKECSDNCSKFHDPENPEKQLLPLNWNKLWLGK